MKHLSLVILYLLFFHVNGWADNVPINLCKQINGGINDRSTSIELTASHDNNNIYFYSDIPLSSLQIIVKNENEEILLSEIITIFPELQTPIFIGNLESGTYILELNDGKHKYQGYFEVK